MKQTKLATCTVMVAAYSFVCGNLAWAVDPEVIAKKILCHSCLAKIYASQADAAHATAEYQELLKLTPNDASVHFEYGNVLARNDKPDLAVVQFKAAAKLKPSVPEFQVGLGNSLMYTKDYAGAVAAYTRAIMLGGKNQEQLKNYQELLQKAQQYQAQQKSYEQIQKKIKAQKESEE